MHFKCVILLYTLNLQNLVLMCIEPEESNRVNFCAIKPDVLFRYILNSLGVAHDPDWETKLLNNKEKLVESFKLVLIK